MTRQIVFSSLLALFGSAFAAPHLASATSFCHLKETSDGFVALRSQPSAAAKLIGRMKAQDEVLVGEGRRGNWVKVTWWSGEDRLLKGHEKSAGTGWVNRKLIEDEC
jgi:Bacterial SH3 domain